MRPDRPHKPNRPFLSTKLVSTSVKKREREREHWRGWAGSSFNPTLARAIDRALSISSPAIAAFISTRLRLLRIALREELDSVSRTMAERLIVKKRREEIFPELQKLIDEWSKKKANALDLKAETFFFSFFPHSKIFALCTLRKGKKINNNYLTASAPMAERSRRLTRMVDFLVSRRRSNLLRARIKRD